MITIQHKVLKRWTYTAAYEYLQLNDQSETYRNFAAVKNVSGSSFMSSEFELEDWESREFLEDSMWIALWLREELLPALLACPCLRSVWSEEFVDERFPTCWEGVWVERCLTVEDGGLSLLPDWSLIVARLGGPAIDWTYNHICCTINSLLMDTKNWSLLFATTFSWLFIRLSSLKDVHIQ